ncbi:hypothetical protein ACJJIU_02305 [Microbulbifer sp. CnH-101-E]|uniref:hypothetical protein n=1 Tax=unclassified Microbulbifer TaxID=2619833 RepID=UPI004039033F
MEAEETKEKSGVSETHSMMRLILQPKVMIGVILIYAAILIPMFMDSGFDISYIFKDQLPIIASAFAGLLGFSLVFPEFRKARDRVKEERFVDVDTEREDANVKLQKRILNEVGDLKDKVNDNSTSQIEKLIKDLETKKKEASETLFSSFESYFNEIRSVLVEQAHTADKKASILLDKGTSYSKGGIYFFTLSIVIWQALSWSTGFKEQYIFGIVSCSLLFIFIEFLAAWYLKQYRHFVDTSTYHIKVKSIFDKHMLSYLTIKTLGDDSQDIDSKYKAMLRVLEEDIKWPESYLMKNGDVSFAREAMETMTHFAKAMKTEAKNSASK